MPDEVDNDGVGGDDMGQTLAQGVRLVNFSAVEE
jgi:hypothetical protein